MRIYYQLKLPKQDFMDTYLLALRISDIKERKSLLSKLFAMINIDPDYLNVDETVFSQADKLSSNEIEYNVVYFREKIKKIEEMIIANHPAKISIYYIVLYRLRELLYQINKDDALDVEEDFNMALSSSSDDEKIKSLEAIFAHIDKKINIDYDNYLIKRF